MLAALYVFYKWCTLLTLPALALPGAQARVHIYEWLLSQCNPDQINALEEYMDGWSH